MGTLLKYHRINLKISKSELSNKAHVSRQYISRIEQNVSFPTEPVLKRICKVLGLCPYQLIDFCHNCSLSNDCNKKNIFLRFL